MKCPKYIKEALRRRTAAAERFLDLDGLISRWLSAHGLEDEAWDLAYNSVDALINSRRCEAELLRLIESHAESQRKSAQEICKGQKCPEQKEDAE